MLVVFRSKGVVCLCACLALFLTAGGASAQMTKPEIVDAAKKEGKVVFYTTGFKDINTKIAEGFKEKFGISVEWLFLGTEALIGKFTSEFQLGAPSADVLWISSVPVSLRKEGYLAQYHSSEIAAIPKSVLEVFNKPNGYWYPGIMVLYVIGVNTKHVPMAEAPKSWKDLTDPRFKDKIIYADPNFSGDVLRVISTIGTKLHNWDFYEKFAANNPMIVRGHGQVQTFLESGERPIAGEQGHQRLLKSKNKGNPIETVWPEEGIIVSPWSFAISKKAPHPNAARLLIDYMLTQKVQQMFVDVWSIYPVREGVAPPKGLPKMEDLKLVTADTDWLEANKSKTKKRFWDYIGK